MVSEIDPGCPFCRVLNFTPFHERNPYDVELASTPSFVVMPALGPLRAGHVIVVSREHTPNLLANDTEVLKEYEALIASMRTRPGYSRNTLEAEHGPSITSRGGACIDHTHVNVIPGAGQLLDIVAGQQELLSERETVVALPRDAAPYLLLRAANSGARLYDAAGVESQLIRRQIASASGRDDWDWAVFPMLDIVRETLQFWSA